ncbi:nucleotide sugar dehydrogenase [Salipaludibacillus sp. HK11]|uniref:nucleotide sugar dehydrogenase n=1 Tax=Salipaludibacillus sp. HK11 TaxID=3394320 RepID=UPI0039FC6000
MKENLQTKLVNKTAHVGVIGLGYVGLPLALAFCQKGYTVFGIDINEEKLERLQNGDSYIAGIRGEDIKTFIDNNTLIITNDFSVISDLDSISICVPTPLTKYQHPDVTYIEAVVNQIKTYMRKETLLILESTSYPGTTEELIEIELQQNGWIVGKDYFLCFSPERVDPGNATFNTKNTPKVIGGTTKLCTQLGICLYKGAVETLVPVSSPKIAEMSKLLENSFRSVNIGFINEMAMLSDRLGLDIWETIDAASSKPFGFMPFSPGPGIGGHCIPLDPMYLSWKGRGLNFYSRYLDLAQEINKKMPNVVLNKISDVLNEIGAPIKGSKILLLGMSYKPNIGDLRESPSLEVYESLQKKGADVYYNDPHVPQFKDYTGKTVTSIDLRYDKLNIFDCVLLLTSHDSYHYQLIADNAERIVDTRNAFKNIKNSKIITIWGAPSDHNS